MNKNKDYSLTFHEALDILLEDGYVRGDTFAKGFYLDTDSLGQLVLVDANNFYQKTPFAFIKSLSTQKYRQLTVMTLKELSY